MDHADESTSKPKEMLSPGPLKMSDLETSAHEGHQLPPRRLEPIINPVVAKKRKRTKKKEKPSTTTEDQTVSTDTVTAMQTSPTLLGESMLSRLRSRLDPLYNASPPPAPSINSSLPPVKLPPLEQSIHGPTLPRLSAEERGNEQASIEGESSIQELSNSDTSQKRSRRRTRLRKNDTQRTSPRQPTDTQDEATISEQVAEQHEELKSTSREALIAGTMGGSERKKHRRRDRERARRTSGHSVGEDTPDAGVEVTAEVTGEQGLHSSVDDGAPPPTSQDSGRRSRGRQLPTPPFVDGEDALEPGGPISTMADELATTGGIPTTRGDFVHPDDPQFLVSEEDIVEVGPDELQGTTRLFQPVLQPHPSVSQPKDVIFVERKDGRGFAAQRKDTLGGDEVERGIFSGEREISSSQFAIYSHKAIQHLAFIAHGLVAGISLWDCVVSNILSRGGSGLHIDLLTHYHPLTLPANAIHVFLLSIVMLSLLDRFDFSSVNKECLQSFFKTPVQIILLIACSLVFIALILTLSVAAIDERIALYPYQPSLWTDVLVPINTTTTPNPATPLPTTHTDVSLSLIYIPGSNLVSSRVAPWLALAIVRAICCCVSWILVVWTSDYDRLLDYLNSIEEQSSGIYSTNKE